MDHPIHGDCSENASPFFQIPLLHNTLLSRRGFILIERFAVSRNNPARDRSAIKFSSMNNRFVRNFIAALA
jgi:hypothetical protein